MSARSACVDMKAYVFVYLSGIQRIPFDSVGFGHLFTSRAPYAPGWCLLGAAARGQGESSPQSQHLNGNSRSVSRAEHSLNQCAIGLTRGPFISSVFSVPIRHPFF